jgi:hypothetical protein
MKRGLSRVWRVATHHLGLKIIALILALILFLIARVETIREVDIEIPVVVTAAPPGKILVSELPGSIKLRVRASIQELTGALTNRTPYTLELGRYATSQTVILKPEDFEEHLDGAVSVLGISPGRLTIEYDEEGTREVRVNVQIDRTPARHWKLEAPPMASPNAVTARGRLSILTALHSIPTAPVDLSGIRSATSLEVKLEPPSGVRVSPDKVHLRVDVVPEMSSRTIRWVTPRVENCPEGYSCSISPSSFTVQVSGLAEQVSVINEQTLGEYVFVDVASAGFSGTTRESRAMLKVRVRPIKGVEFEFPDGAFFSVGFAKID